MSTERVVEGSGQQEAAERKPWKAPQLEEVEIAGFTQNTIGAGGDGECIYASHS